MNENQSDSSEDTTCIKKSLEKVDANCQQRMASAKSDSDSSSSSSVQDNQQQQQQKRKKKRPKKKKGKASSGSQESPPPSSGSDGSSHESQKKKKKRSKQAPTPDRIKRNKPKAALVETTSEKNEAEAVDSVSATRSSKTKSVRPATTARRAKKTNKKLQIRQGARVKILKKNLIHIIGQNEQEAAYQKPLLEKQPKNKLYYGTILSGNKQHHYQIRFDEFPVDTSSGTKG